MKKPALLIALGRGPKGGDSEEEDAPSSSEGYSPEEKKALAGDVLDAVKAGDKTGLADALEAFVMACMEE
jgi:hypothetical protein